MLWSGKGINMVISVTKAENPEKFSKWELHIADNKCSNCQLKRKQILKNSNTEEDPWPSTSYLKPKQENRSLF